MKLELIMSPNKLLETPGKKVRVIVQKHRELAASMLAHMKKWKGLGLSANQVGRDMALFVADDGKRKLVAFNPEIMLVSDEKEVFLEGCLSLPNEFYDIERPRQVTLSYQDATGGSKTETFRGLMARIIQHEMLHINGMIFEKPIDN